MPNNPIKNWAIDDRPREKLLLKGCNVLSNNGTRQASAVEVCKELLKQTDNDLQKLARLSVKEILKLKVKGIGEAKAIAITAALELGLRRDVAEKKLDVVIQSRDVAEYLRAQFKFKKHEIFAVLYLNRANKIKHSEIISEGGITGTVADPRIILKKALENDAVSIILCHNHPSGSLKPSRADEELTKKITEAASYFDIKVLDHIIVIEEGFFSFADEGLL